MGDDDDYDDDDDDGCYRKLLLKCISWYLCGTCASGLRPPRGEPSLILGLESDLAAQVCRLQYNFEFLSCGGRGERLLHTRICSSSCPKDGKGTQIKQAPGL